MGASRSPRQGKTTETRFQGLLSSEARIQPVDSFLAVEPTEVSNSCDFKDNNTVVVIDGSDIEKRIYHAAGTERCLNDPKGKQGPAKIHS